MNTPYRDDFAAANEKLAELEQELLAVRTKAHELSNLKRDEVLLARRVVELRRRLDGMAKKRALPLLDSVRIASPCKADWNTMTGDERVRFCPQCEKNVFNLSGMRREDAEHFVRENAGGACVRLYRRTDGTVLTADCPVGRKRKRMRNVALATIGGSMLAAGALFSWRSPLSATTGRPTGPGVGLMEAPQAERLVGTPTAAPEVHMGDMALEPLLHAKQPASSEKNTVPRSNVVKPPPPHMKHP